MAFPNLGTRCTFGTVSLYLHTKGIFSTNIGRCGLQPWFNLSSARCTNMLLSTLSWKQKYVTNSNLCYRLSKGANRHISERCDVTEKKEARPPSGRNHTYDSTNRRRDTDPRGGEAPGPRRRVSTAGIDPECKKLYATFQTYSPNCPRYILGPQTPFGKDIVGPRSKGAIRIRASDKWSFRRSGFHTSTT